MKHKLVLVLLSLVIAVAFMPASAFASSKTMTAYDQVIKSGNTAYCMTSAGIYKVKLKNHKVKSKKKIFKANSEEPMYGKAMKKVKGYLYFKVEGPVGAFLVRVKTSGGKGKYLLNPDPDWCLDDYVISGGKIYYKLEGMKSNKYKKMKLNGAAKKKTSVKAVLKTKKANAKGYKIIEKEKKKNGDYYIYSWLKTPKQKYLLGKFKTW